MLARLLILLPFLFLSIANAKDMHHRLGVGFKNQFAMDLPAISTTYFLSKDFALGAALGVDTQRANSRFGFMAKLQRVVFHEDNLHFYMGAGAGLISYESTSGTTQTTESGFELLGFAGSEFYFSGLENLGFNMEFGVGVTSIASGVRFRTLADNPFRAGITFYF